MNTPPATVELKDLLEWFHSLPEDHKVNMGEADRLSLLKNDGCGCLMVQYAVHKGWDFQNCGTNYWKNKALDPGKPLPDPSGFTLLQNNGRGFNIFDLFIRYKLRSTAMDTHMKFGTRTVDELKKLMKEEFLQSEAK